MAKKVRYKKNSNPALQPYPFNLEKAHRKIYPKRKNRKVRPYQVD